jgi:hypothetical protein
MSLVDLISHFPPSLALVLFPALVLVFIVPPAFLALSRSGLDLPARRLVGAYFDKILRALYLILAICILLFVVMELRERPPPEAPQQKTPALPAYVLAGGVNRSP